MSEGTRLPVGHEEQLSSAYSYYQRLYLFSENPTPYALAKAKAYHLVAHDILTGNIGIGLIKYWQLSKKFWAHPAGVQHDIDHRLAGLTSMTLEAADLRFYRRMIALAKGNPLKKLQAKIFYKYLRNSKINRSAWEENVQRNARNLRAFEKIEAMKLQGDALRSEIEIAMAA